MPEAQLEDEVFVVDLRAGAQPCPVVDRILPVLGALSGVIDAIRSLESPAAGLAVAADALDVIQGELLDVAQIADARGFGRMPRALSQALRDLGSDICDKQVIPDTLRAVWAEIERFRRALGVIAPRAQHDRVEAVFDALATTVRFARINVPGRSNTRRIDSSSAQRLVRLLVAAPTGPPRVTPNYLIQVGSGATPTLA